MTSELVRLTCDPAIEDLPFEKRHPVCAATAMAAHIDNLFLALNPECQVYFRRAVPDEISAAQAGEVWVVAVRRDIPGDPFRAYIRLPESMPSDSELSWIEIADALLKLGVLSEPCDGHKTIRQLRGPNARVSVVDAVKVLMT
jgi:hypothetical protein